MAIAIDHIISIFVSIFSVSILFLCAASGEIKMFNTIQYNTIQCNAIPCSSAQSTKYGRLFITMSVNKWDNS